jgi:hypothetical protein
VRDLAVGPDAFFAALAGAPQFDADGFAAFLTWHKLLDWVAPELTSARGEPFVTPAFREQLLAHQKARRVHNQTLLLASEEVRAELAGAGIDCLFLKGLYFGQRFHGDVNRRQQGDVDLLVRSAAFEAALAGLARLGFDVTTNLDDGKPVSERVREIRGRTPARAPHAVTVRRGSVRLDLHWCLDSRSFARVDEAQLWLRRQRYAIEGFEFETLGDEDALGFLLVSLCGDLRRGACRAKHFLDLHLMLRELDSSVRWEDFCQRQREQGWLRVAINVLAIYLNVWDCAAELPGVSRSLTKRLRQVELRDGAEALALLERPRGNPENPVWYRRVHPRSRWRSWIWRTTRDLPHTLARATRPRSFALSDR